MSEPGFLQKHAGAIVAVGIAIATSTGSAVWTTATVTTQVVELRKQVDALQQDRAAQISDSKAIAVLQAQVEAANARLASIDTKVDRLVLQRFGSLP